MGNQCNAAHADDKYDTVPAYPAQYFSDFSSNAVPKPPTKELPRLGLRGQGPSSVISLGQTRQELEAFKGKPFLPKVKPFMGIDEEDGLYPLPVPMDNTPPLYPVPVPMDNTPPGRSSELTESEYPRFFPVSSYAVPDAPLRKQSRHVNFANSPTHSVHRSEYGVKPYSEVYGMHPRDFDFDEFGNKTPREATSLMNPFLPREAAYLPRDESFLSREPSYCQRPSRRSEFRAQHQGTFTSMSAYRSNATGNSDMYSTHMEWGDW